MIADFSFSATLQISGSSISPLDVLGEGYFGVVKACELVEADGSTKTVAVKYLKQDSSDSDLACFQTEASKMIPLQHRNILKIIGVGFSEAPYFIALELMPNGDLKQYITGNNGRLRTGQLVRLARDVASGIAYLATMNYVHRDLAARNVLLSHEFTAKIADFGMSRHVRTDDVCMLVYQ